MEPTRNMQDDSIRELVREQGMIKAPSGLTGRIMQWVEAADRTPAPVYKPLLTRNTMIGIAAFIALLMIIAGYVVNPDPTDKSFFFSTLKPIFDKITQLNISVKLPVGSLVIATIASASIGLLLSMDILLFRRFREA